MGDWIRVGGVEFIIRFCGGSCACPRHHDHYCLHGLRLLREHSASARYSAPRGTWRRALAKDRRLSAQSSNPELIQSRAATNSIGDGVQHESNGDDQEQNSSDESDSEIIEDELLLLLNSRRCRGWTPSSSRLCQRSAMTRAGLSSKAFECRTPSVSSTTPALESAQQAKSGSNCIGRSFDMPTPVPIAPLELDFISGPRMGEKLMLSERVCTLGRGEGNAIQVNDSQLASVSRVHCIFEYRGNWWHIRDNGSTNGTWRRLSCILQPSDPIPLHQGVSIQAGAHEFFVEEATMRRSWFPSTASQSFEELCEQERHHHSATTSERGSFPVSSSCPDFQGISDGILSGTKRG